MVEQTVDDVYGIPSVRIDDFRVENGKLVAHEPINRSSFSRPVMGIRITVKRRNSNMDVNSINCIISHTKRAASLVALFVCKTY
ncbi:hypothetical protein D3C74_296170 [compost metagenome]